MHILYLIDVLWGRAGAESTLLRMARLLPPERYRCSIVTFRLRPELPMLKDFPHPVYEFPLERPWGISSIQTAVRLRAFIRDEKVDIVHTFFPAADLWGGLVAKLSPGAPLLISSRRDMGILRSWKYRIAYRLLGPMYDQVQAVSESVQRYTIHADRIEPSRVITIPNGIDLGRVQHPLRSQEQQRQDLQILPDAPVILCVAHIRRVKGIDVLLRAAERVCSKLPNAIFLLVGSVQEPDYGRQLQQMVEELGLWTNVRFLGKSESVASLLNIASVFCLLSRSEGMSNALLEAMGSALPCVTTAVGGTPEMIEDGRTGFLVENEDFEAAAKRMVELLENPERARTIGEAARRYVESRHSAQSMVEALTSSYEQLLESSEQKAVRTHAERIARAEIEMGKK